MKFLLFSQVLIFSQTAVAIQTFFLLMANHPDVQSKAQKEIDTVVGKDRLPMFEDRATLPYITAIIREILRWHVRSLPARISKISYHTDFVTTLISPRTSRR